MIKWHVLELSSFCFPLLQIDACSVHVGACSVDMAHVVVMELLPEIVAWQQSQEDNEVFKAIVAGHLSVVRLTGMPMSEELEEWS